MIVGRVKTVLIKYGPHQETGCIYSPSPLSLFFPSFSLRPAALSLHLWPSFHPSSPVKLFKLSPSSSFPPKLVSFLSLYLSFCCSWDFIDNLMNILVCVPTNTCCYNLCSLLLSSSCSTTYRESAASSSPEPGSTQQRSPAHWATSTPSTSSTET